MFENEEKEGAIVKKKESGRKQIFWKKRSRSATVTERETNLAFSECPSFFFVEHILKGGKRKIQDWLKKRKVQEENEMGFLEAPFRVRYGPKA